MNASKGDLVNELAGACGLTQQDAAHGLDTLLDAITQRTAAGEKVIIRGFGTFQMKSRAARTGRNPQTGLPVDIPASTTLTFKAAKPKA